MKKVTQVCRFYDRIEEIALVLMLSISVILLFINVILRYIFNSSLYGADELARILFIWMSWLGISIGERKCSHICIDMMVSKLHGVPERVVKILANLITLGILFVLVYYGMDVVRIYARKGVTTAMYKVPQSLVYFSVPYSCAVMAIRRVVDTVKIFTPQKQEG